jgi:uncharacterized protein
MIALDTNVLIYAHRPDSPMHARAARSIGQLVEDPSPWAVPWPCLHEFIAVVTHPKVFGTPSTTDEAFDQFAAWLDTGLVLLGESTGYLDRLKEVVRSSGVKGPKIHDARIAALCLDHGIDELWSSDRDFSRFPALRVRNPLVNPPAVR